MCQQCVNNLKKMTYFNQKIQYYKSFLSNEGNVLFSSKCRGELSLRELLDQIKTPNVDQKKFIDNLRKESDPKKRSYLKSQLTGYLVPSYGTGKSRTYDEIINYTGLTCLDFDGDNVKSYSDELKKHLFDSYPFIIAAFKSPSGKVKCIINLKDVNSKEEYKNLYRGLEYQFKDYEGFDPCYNNAVLVMFYTYDNDILIRDNASQWDRTIKPKPRVPVPSVPIINDNLELNQKRVYGIISKGLNTITDNGHYVVRSYSNMLGRFVAAGYVSQYDAENFIHQQIENHSYLIKSPETYKKTATTFIEYGINEGALELYEN